MARCHSDAALGVASPTPHRSTPNTTGSWTTFTTRSPLCVITSIKPGQTSSRSHASPPGCGPRSGPTTRVSASTATSADAPTPWESSPTAKPSSAWWEPSSPNKTTNGPKADATSVSTSSPHRDSHHNPPNRRTPHSHSAHNPTRRTQNDYTTPQDLTGSVWFFGKSPPAKHIHSGLCALVDGCSVRASMVFGCDKSGGYFAITQGAQHVHPGGSVEPSTESQHRPCFLAFRGVSLQSRASCSLGAWS